VGLFYNAPEPTRGSYREHYPLVCVIVRTAGKMSAMVIFGEHVFGEEVNVQQALRINAGRYYFISII